MNRRDMIKGGAVLSLTATMGLRAGSAAAAVAGTEVFTAGEQGGVVDSTLILGEKKALVVDAQFIRAEAEALVARIEASGRDLETVFITHTHPDHYLGTEFLLNRWPDAKVYAHPDVAANIAKTGGAVLARWQGMMPGGVADRLIVPDALTADHLMLEGEKINILPPMHGDTDIISPVLIESLDTVIVADLVYNRTHVWAVENTTDERLDAWRASLAAVRALNVGTIIPGHRAADAANDASAIDFMLSYLDAWQSLLGTTTDPEVFKAALSERVGTLPGAFILDFNALGGTGNLNFDNG